MLNNLAHSAMLEKLRRSGRINLADDAFGWGFVDAITKDRTDGVINDALSRAGVLFETRSLSLMHLPFVFSENLKTDLEGKFARLHKIIERIPALYLASAAVRAFFRLPPMMDEFVRINCNVDPNVFLCRYDFSLTPSGSPRIYELNAAAPAALSFSPYFFQALTSTELFAQIKSQVPFAMEPFLAQREPLFMKGIRDFVSAKCGHARPTLGIVNSRINTMVNELMVMEREAGEIGLDVVRSFVEDLQLAGGTLLANGRKVDALFAKIDITPGTDFECPITRSRTDIEALLAGIRAGVPYINPFCSSFLIDNKSTLAFLQSKLASPILDQSERSLIEEIVPVTKMLHQLSPTEFGNISDYKDKWVLKKSLDTRGRSVVIGSSISALEWRKALEGARRVGSENYVVQRFESPEHCLSGGQPLYTSHAYFLLRGQPCGAFTRTSKSLVTNVGSGGSVQVPLIGHPLDREEINPRNPSD